jgi:putative ABC transport system permease protein
MPFWSRIANLFRGDKLNREIDEELESHIAEAVAQGRDPVEARRAFGPPLQLREESRDVRLIPWLDSLRADTIFGWRQLRRNKVTSAAAILSLALAIGASTSAFRLIDALLLRPLPVAHAQQLYALSRQFFGFDSKLSSYDNWAYPAFQQMRAAVKDRAELIALSYAERLDLTYRSDQEMEKGCVQYVSGWMFNSFGLRPAVGRLLTGNDDLKPGAHPYAVLSHDYWANRFGKDPKVVGRTFRFDNRVYQIVGVVDGPFTGTETGTVVDIFLPAMMHQAATRNDSTWHRTLAQLKPGVAIEPFRQTLDRTSRAFEENRAKGFTGMPKSSISRFLDQKLLIESAASGTSVLQQSFRRPLIALGVLVALVLLIACANVANLMTAQAAARAREMALRVSVGAGRRRLVQLVMVQSAMLAFIAASLGGLFAWWSAPFVVSRINPPDNPARLTLPADLPVLAFGVGLTILVMFLFGLAPAMRASAVEPASALKGGSDPHSRRRLMHVLIAVQVAFCFLVLFAAGLFAATFHRLSKRPIGFSAERVLALETVAKEPQLPVFWEQVAEQLRAVPAVEAVAIAGWPLLGGGAMNNFISVNGAPPGPVLGYFLPVSPGWIDAMKISLIAGRDFRADETSPGAALINETFARQFFPSENPVGKTFARGRSLYQVVGLVHDAPYRSMREPILPVAYIPVRAVNGSGILQPVSNAAFIVRSTGADPLALAPTLRREISHARSGFRVSNARAEADLVRAQTLRERLLAMLALFFAVVAILLAGVGLYGVLDYSVLQRRREIGIRMAIGAQAGDVALGVTTDAFVMVLTGAVAGCVLGMGSARYVEGLLYQVKATDAEMVALPWVMILVVALLAAVPAVVRAVRIDPVAALRAE